MGKTYRNKIKEKDFYKKCAYTKGTQLYLNRLYNGDEYCCKRTYKEARSRINRKFKGSLLSNGVLKKIRVWDMYW